MLLEEYENQVKMQLLIEQRNNQDANFLPAGSTLEKTIWSYIGDNIRRAYENELKWIQDLRGAIINLPDQNDKTEIENTKVITREFRNSIAESGRHNVLKLFTNIGDAEEWFIKLRKK